MNKLVEFIKDCYLAVLIAIILMVISGCATAPEALIPIAVPCKVTSPNVPTYRFAPPYGDIFDAVRDLLGDREVSLAYEEELRVAFSVCR